MHSNSAFSETPQLSVDSPDDSLRQEISSSGCLYAWRLHRVVVDTAGLLPVAQPDLSQIAGGDVSSSGSLWDNGEWWMLLAAQSMALGTIMVRWVSK